MDPKAGVDSDADGDLDRQEYNGSDLIAAPAGWNDTNHNGLRDAGEVSQIDPATDDPAIPDPDDFDLVLDPIRNDTDRDGISDATEIIGFKITRVTDGSTFVVSTNPNSPFTDSDTFSDGFERLVGLDPTNGSDTDEDGDGLSDLVEEAGWTVRTYGVSTSPHQQGSLASNTRYSETDSVDSDGDGLTDYEEFFLKTDPSSNDTDGDGIVDRTEHLGYTLGHKVGDLDIGIIKTDPLDADTDNDKRSDGAEAELVDIELNRWAVGVAGLAPYRVYSNPLVADADFDGVVDGDEFSGTYRTDPNNSNTDGDTRHDGQEFNAGTNPLIEDFQVTVFFNSLFVIEGGDSSATNPGEYMFQLGVRKPDLNGTAGLSSDFTPVVTESIDLTSPFNFVYTGDSQVEPYLPAGGGSKQNDQGGANIPGILLGDGEFLNFAQYLPTANRSISFGMTANQSFALEGIVAEKDDAFNDFSYVYLGGFDGVQATDPLDSTKKFRPIFNGSDLQSMVSPFLDVTIRYESNNWIRLGQGQGAIIGEVRFTIFVS